MLANSDSTYSAYTQHKAAPLQIQKCIHTGQSTTFANSVVHTENKQVFQIQIIQQCIHAGYMHVVNTLQYPCLATGLSHHLRLQQEASLPTGLLRPVSSSMASGVASRMITHRWCHLLPHPVSQRACERADAAVHVPPAAACSRVRVKRIGEGVRLCCWASFIGEYSTAKR